jgi:hypothetical protein
MWSNTFSFCETIKPGLFPVPDAKVRPSPRVLRDNKAHKERRASRVSRAMQMLYIPGRGFAGSSEYRANHAWRAVAMDVQFEIRRASGVGEAYDQILIFQIESSEVINNTNETGKIAGTARPGQFLVPPDLDVSDYFAVLEYFGIDL